MRFGLLVKGASPLLMHSARLSDPLDPAAQALKDLTSQRTKTDDLHRAIGKAEFVGSLYFDQEFGPYVPGANMLRCLIEAGKMTKQGTALVRSLLLSTLMSPLIYEGPRTVEELWKTTHDSGGYKVQTFAARHSVRVQQSRTMRTRPHFAEWGAKFEGVLDEEIVSWEDFKKIATRAGQSVGLGDWRPLYGRFEIVSLEELKS